MIARFARISLGAVAFLFSAMLIAAAQIMAVTITQVTVTPNAAAYSAGQCLGGVLAVPGMIRVQGAGGGKLSGVSFADPQHQTAANSAMTLYVFKALPTGTYTDHANCNINAADVPNLIGSVSIAAANCVQDQAPTNTVCTITPNLPIAAGALPATSSNIWVIPVAAATPTYGAAASLYFNFMGEPYSGN